MFFSLFVTFVLLAGMKASNASGPDPIRIPPISVTSDSHLCFFKSNIIMNNKVVKLASSGNCVDYIYPPFLEIQHGVNKHLIKVGEKRHVFKKVLNFDCRKTGFWPAIDYQQKRIPQGFRIVEESKGGRINALDFHDYFKEVMRKADKLSGGFLPAFYRTKTIYTPFQLPREVYVTHIIHYIFYKVLCVEMATSLSLDQEFLRDLKNLPEQWDPINYIGFIRTYGSGIATSVCIGGEMMIRSKGKTYMEHLGFGQANLEDLTPSVLQRINLYLGNVHDGRENGSIYSNVPLEESWFEKNQVQPGVIEKWIEKVKKFPTIIEYVNTTDLSAIVFPLNKIKAKHIETAIKLVNIHNLSKKALLLINHILPNGLLLSTDQNVVEELNSESEMLCPNIDLLYWLNRFTSIP